jgi:hypothetical protein
MATLVKTVEKTATEAEWEGFKARFHRGNREETFEAAAKKARRLGYAQYVYTTHGGFQVTSERPVLPPGNRYYEITVVGDTIIGKLFET